MANKTRYTLEQAAALCDLYKVVPASENDFRPTTMRYSPADQIARGLLFVDGNCKPIPVIKDLFLLALDMYGIDGDEMTATFYKSFKTVTEKSRWELFVDQVIHYAGTYGMEAMGYQPMTIIPMQYIEVPDVDVSKVKVTVIRVLDDGPIVNLVNESYLSVKQPSKRIAMRLESLVELIDIDLNDIRSFELAIFAFDHYHMAPRNGKMVLRYLIYKTAGQSLVIKNQRLVNAIKHSDKANTSLTHDILIASNPIELAAIFLRYKDLFLAFKSHQGCAPLINRLRRLADTYHRPLSDVTIQNYVQFAIQGDRSKMAELRKKMDARDMVKLCNAMIVRLNTRDGAPAVYSVRNGRAYCVEETHKALTKRQSNSLQRELDVLYGLLVDTLSFTVKNKAYYIPDYIHYAVPQSEKQFVGNIPWGTVIPLNKDALTVGVHWLNQDNGDRRVDLDLHAFSPTQHYGWNGGYTSGNTEVVYSGDMTSAPLPHGAAEAFWIANPSEPIIFNLNVYAGPEKMPYKLYFSGVKFKPFDGWADRMEKPFTMNPNELLMAPIPMEFTGGDRGMALGFYDDNQFYFYSGNMSNGAVPRGNYAKYLEAVMNVQKFHLNMADLLVKAGATVYSTKEDYENALAEGVNVVDLSPEALTATSLTDIVDGKA